MSNSATSLSSLLRSHRNQVGICVVLLLAWLMQADEEAAPEERRLLLQIAEGSNLSRSLVNQLIQIAASRSLNDIGLACQLLRQGLGREERLRLLEMYVGMMIVDGFITIPEQHVVRFLADLFEISPHRLRQIYQDATGRAMPDLGDPSSLNWWRKKERSRNTSEGRENGNRSSRYRGDKRNRRSRHHRTSSMTHTRALAILGLEKGASEEEIKTAYRHLAKVHHPDRYQQIGPEAVQTANETFQRINAAYDYLS